MDQQETIALWNECQAAKRAALEAGADEDTAQAEAARLWNEWADRLLAGRKKLEHDGQWVVDETDEGLNEATRTWQEQAACDFHSVRFVSLYDEFGSRITNSNEVEEEVSVPDNVISVACEGSAIDFRNFHFPSEALFNGADFSGWARFDNAAFFGWADFENAAFGGGAYFQNVIFSCWAQFNNSIFSEYAVFHNATFSKDAMFNGATFSGENALFYNITFSGEAEFNGVTFSGNAQFKETIFSAEAKFDGTKFSETAGFTKAVFSGKASFGDVNFSGQFTEFYDAVFHNLAWFLGANFAGTAGFRGVRFSDKAIFISADFSGHAQFDNAAFSSKAEFYNAIFSDVGMFKSAIFGDEAKFSGATFSSTTSFCGATFENDVWFRDTTFKTVLFALCKEQGKPLQPVRFTGDANFTQANFTSMTDFKGAIFEKDAVFTAIRGERAFSLDGTQFAHVPNFIQASFTEAPRLDNMRFERRPFWRSMFSKTRDELAVRYRELRKLAVTGNDHEQEMNFFANEIRARRHGADKFWHGQFWFGLLYEVFSDVGRSYLRPLLAWLGLLVGFVFIYASYFRTRADGIGCENWPQSSWLKPEIYLSFLNNLPLAGLVGGKKREAAIACMTGSAEKLTPGADLLFTVQNMLSIAPLFLLMLALRNHFRIK